MTESPRKPPMLNMPNILLVSKYLLAHNFIHQCRKTNLCGSKMEISQPQCDLTALFCGLSKYDIYHIYTWNITTPYSKENVRQHT